MGYKCEICGQTVLSKEQEENLISEYKERLKLPTSKGKKTKILKELADLYKIKMTTLYTRILVKHGFIKKKIKIENAALVKSVINLYENENNCIEILSKKLNINPRTSRIILEANSLTYRKKEGKEDFKKDLAVYTYYEEHGTLKAVKKFNFSKNKIRRLIEKWNFKKRKNNDLYRKYSLNETIFDNFDNEIAAYIAGLIAADGTIRKRFNIISIELAYIDIELLEKIRDIFQTEKPIEKTKHTDKRTMRKNDGCRLAIFSEKMVSCLKQLNIMSNKSITLDLNLDLISTENQKHFWRGMVDGDGSLFFRNHFKNGKHYDGITIELLSTRGVVLMFAKYIKENLGINPHKEVQSSKTKELYSIKYQAKEEALSVAEFLYKDSNIFLLRKYNLAKTWFENKNLDLSKIKQLCLKIVKEDELSPLEIYDDEIDPQDFLKIVSTNRKETE